MTVRQQIETWIEKADSEAAAYAAESGSENQIGTHHSYALGTFEFQLKFLASLIDDARNLDHLKEDIAAYFT